MVELILQIFFLVAVILIWFMIAYQLVLTIAGYAHYVASAKEQKHVDAVPFDFPPVSLLIPAHNEEKVIGRTLEAMSALEYPKEKLEIVVINDGSTDSTADIASQYAKQYQNIRLLTIPPGEGGKGKSRALNIGVSKTTSEIVAVYDADNTPDPSSLKYLVAQLLLHPELGAVLGKFRTVNKARNILTRFINIETLSFQSILQAGRWKLFKVSTIPGTNFVIRRSLLTKLGGWDEEAITEDSELTVRIYMENFRVKYIPYALTYEQEPETWKVWLRQRTRWVRGNNYVVSKFVREIPHFKNKFLGFEVFYLLSLYYIFLAAIVASDIFFLLGVTNVIVILLPGPYTAVWVLAVVLFLLEIFLVLSYDREDTTANFLLMMLMYITYCQLWIYVVARALWADFVAKERRTWVKTERFDVENPSGVAEK
ncbi:MAG: glycosyltransferase family 2 protein [Bacteroidota bacterium]|nr:glycosyltransferase family 2 protein [Bacteroidota bacterium]